MKRFIPIVFLIGTMFPVDAWAQGTPSKPPSGQTAASVEAEARKYYHGGIVHYQAGRYTAARAAFTKGYELTKKPGFLWNMAESERALGDRRAAVALYEQYLRESKPSAPQRAEAERHIEVLEKKPRTKPATARTKTPPGPRKDKLRARPLAPIPERDEGTSGPIYNTWWFWTGAGAVVVTTVVAAVLVNRSGSEAPAPGTPTGSYTVDWR